MPTPDENARSASTTWEWKRVKVRRPAEGPSSTAPKESSPGPQAQWDPRTPLSVTLVYRGGGECWYEVRARGRVLRFPGATAMHDVMVEVYRSR